MEASFLCILNYSNIRVASAFPWCRCLDAQIQPVRNSPLSDAASIMVNLSRIIDKAVPFILLLISFRSHRSDSTSPHPTLAAAPNACVVHSHTHTPTHTGFVFRWNQWACVSVCARELTCVLHLFFPLAQLLTASSVFLEWLQWSDKNYLPSVRVKNTQESKISYYLHRLHEGKQYTGMRTIVSYLLSGIFDEGQTKRSLFL